MSAENLGRRLLGEVHEEGLDELLHSLRLLHNVDKQSQLGIPPLDRLLHIFQQPATSTQHHHPADRSSSPPHPGTAQSRVRSLNKKTPIIELTSTTPGAGKTHLLYLLTTRAILPSVHSGIRLNGLSSAVVVLDTDNRFDILRLAEVIRHHVVSCQQAQQAPALSDQALETLIQASLKHVHIYRPQSMASLLATLATIPEYLFDPVTHHSTQRPVHSIILDSASAFLWPVRAEEEMAKLASRQPNPDPTEAASNPTPTASGPTTSPWTQLARHLRTLQRTFDCAVVYTSWSLSPSSSSAPSASRHPRRDTVSLRPALPAPMAQLATLHLMLSREPVPPFAPGMSVQEALAERKERQEVVERGQFWACVNAWDREGWPREVFSELERVGWGFLFSRTLR